MTPPNPDSFVYLPEYIKQEIGETTHQGARLELAVLSCMIYYNQKGKGKAKEYTATGGVKICASPNEFVLSANRIAMNLYYRWFVKTHEDDEYETFFERVRASIRRLKTANYVRFVRTAAGHRNFRYGSIWTFQGTKIENLESMPVCYAKGFVFSAAGTSYTEGGYANVVDLVGGKIIGESHKAYKMGEVCSSLYDRGMFHDYRKWTSLVAKKGLRRPAHTTCGAFRARDIDHIAGAPSYAIYINLDFDEKDFFDNYDSAARIVKFLLDMGVESNAILCSWTGGKGIHIQISGGAFGNPVFRRSSNHRGTLSALAKHFFEVRTDKNVFSPFSLIRLIGSIHEKTGDHKRGYFAHEFLARDPFTIISEKGFQPLELPDPSMAKLIPKLVEELVSSADLDHDFDMPEFDQIEEVDEFVINRTVKAALEKGVAEGEDWGDYTGRDARMYILAGYFARRYKDDEDKIMSAMRSENERNDPPLPEYVIRRKVNTAMGTTPKRKTYLR